jgi:aminopeptidase N
MKPAIVFLVALGVASCGDDGNVGPIDAPPDAPPPIGADLQRDIISTGLAIDVGARSATATIDVAPSPSTATSFEIGDIMIVGAVRLADGTPLRFEDRGEQLDIETPPDVALSLEIDYTYAFHNSFNGADSDGYTLLWPYHCGNLFPCRSDPSDGTTFTLSLANLPSGMTAVYPSAITAEAPSYMVAWVIGDLVQTDLGTTPAGTHLSVWHDPALATQAQQGTQNMLASFEWFETTIGPYLFGTEAASVSVEWGPGALGGMEHHPFWHVAAGAIGNQEVNVHEAAHGWFGNGIRIACWEDFVLSEGTVTYLAGRALDVVDPPTGTAIWNGYASELAGIPSSDPVWPDSCGAIDILADNLFTNAPYIRGAFFYRAVALRAGADVLDAAISAFYTEYAGRAARMSDMIRVIDEHPGIDFDVAACAQMWLRDTTIPAIGPCP